MAQVRAYWIRVVCDLNLSRSALNLYSSRRAKGERTRTMMAVSGTTHYETHLYTVTIALWSTAVLAFCRCFSSNSRRLCAADLFSASELETYSEILSVRDKTLAHSVNAADAAAYGDVCGHSQVGVAHRVLVPPSGLDIAERLRELIEAALPHAKTRAPYA